MFCNYCGAQNAHGAQFCQRCGRQFNEPAQPLAQPHSATKMNWQRAAFFGMIIGVLSDILSFLSLGGFGALLVLIIWLGGFFAIGAYTARQTGRVGTGTLSGLAAGLASSIAFFILGVILFNTFLNGMLQPFGDTQMTITQTNADNARAQIMQVWGLFAVLQFGIGIGLGALGGVLGKITARVPSPPSYQ